MKAPPKGLYRLQPPAARSVAATDVTSVYQTDVTSAGPTDTLCLCSNVSVGPADIKSVWATDVTSVASGRLRLAALTERRTHKGFGFDKHTDDRLVADKALYSKSNKLVSELNNRDGDHK
ncbi:hypothetical protein PCANC_08095 [Puccinia coronata f. sp. avenae]|uniref:Uncharacterized protein n=1 Tax=Puccinia coronata f. sp. avenae TaxID=200324 RepID=A0A2N5V3G4_9BASI|nr:hypothetical protein PCANC_08095 [Puccinia coronata f. sp. avenae]